MTELVKHIAGLYTAYNEEQYFEAARLHWIDFGKTYIDSGIQHRRKPVKYPVVITFDVPTDISGEEPLYLTASFMYEDLSRLLLESLTMYNAPQTKEGDHILANAPKAIPTRSGVNSRFSKIGGGQYLVHSIEGFRAAAASFWKENDKEHAFVQAFVRGAPTRYPAYITFVTEYDDDCSLSGVVANCISVEHLSTSISKYV